MPGTGPGMTHRSRMTANTPPPWTLAGFNLGLRLALPVLPGMMAFGLAVGATAARKGLGFTDNLLMNLLVYAGMSQLVAMEAWPERFTLGALAGLAALMITINARMLLMSAALYPWLRASSPWRDLSGAARADRSVLADRNALSRRRRIGCRRVSRIERAAGGRLDGRGLSPAMWAAR